MERDLVLKARGGNLFAFEEIVRRHERRVYAVAFRILRRHDAADDVAQEAFVRAWRNLAEFDAERPFAPWICRIAANLAVNEVRSPRAREEGLPEGHDETRSAAASPLDGVLDAEARRVLAAAVAELPREQRAVFTLRVYEEQSYKEIAEALGIAPGTVMSRLARARGKLRDALLPYLGPAAARAGGGGS
ncbi:MAG TPA: sigma-70 family RNA polymerase sigma factor [Vicinamibacteria bacterium]|nr:sigma-70 family RNA polymerase sigma factor [Vicinamibacteria bacterium]